MAAVRVETVVSALQILIVIEDLRAHWSRITEYAEAVTVPRAVLAETALSVIPVLECIIVQDNSTCRTAGDGTAGSACGGDYNCNNGLQCVFVQGSDICAAVTGAPGSACNDNNDCADTSGCVLVQNSRVCTAAGDGTAGSVCVGGRLACNSGLECVLARDNWICAEAGGTTVGAACNPVPGCSDGLLCVQVQGSSVCR